MGQEIVSGKPSCRSISRKTFLYSIHFCLSPTVIGTSESIDQSESRRYCLAVLIALAAADKGSTTTVTGSGASPTSNQPWSDIPAHDRSLSFSLTPANPKIGPQFSGRSCGLFRYSFVFKFFNCHSFICLFLC